MMPDYIYKNPFLPSGVDGYCALTCCMGVMNYFWNTSFCRQNNWEMMKVMKGGNYSWEEILDLPEIAYRLERLWFSITFCSSMSQKKFSDYLAHPKEMIFEIMDKKYHHFIKDEFFLVPAYDFRIDLNDVYFEKKVLENSSIKKQYDIDVLSYIQKNQNEDTLFIVGLSSHILHDEPLPEWHNGGHVVIVSEINDEEVIIHDPWVPTLRYYPVPKKRFLAAVQDSWEYNFIQVHYYNGNSEI